MTQQPPQSQIPAAGSAARRDHHRQRSSHVPGDDPGTLMDEDSLTEGGPDAVDAAEPERIELSAEQRINRSSTKATRRMRIRPPTAKNSARAAASKATSLTGIPSASCGPEVSHPRRMPASGALRPTTVRPPLRGKALFCTGERHCAAAGCQPFALVSGGSQLRDPTMKAIARTCIVIAALAAPAGLVLADAFGDTADLFRHAGTSAHYFQDSYGYAVFPTIGKGGFIAGAAHGTGRVYKQGVYVGDTSMTQLSIGFQLGEMAYSEILFFRDADALARFESGNSP